MAIATRPERLEDDPQARQYANDLKIITQFIRSYRDGGSSFDIEQVNVSIDNVVVSANFGSSVLSDFIVDIIYSSYLAGALWVSEKMSGALIEHGVCDAQLSRALELARKGEMTKAAYVARGHVLYNEKFADSFLQMVPPIVRDEIAALPSTARMLDLGCGTGFVGGLCRSLGYGGHLAGLDLVEEMVAAVPPNTYDRTISADAGDWLAASTEKWDAVLSFGVFVHFDLSTVERVLALIADRLRDGGFLAFNAAEGKAMFGHVLILSDLGGILDRVGLYLDAMVRREERTTYLCRKG